ncbi:MAG: amidohydrolase family protein [Gemmatimonadetes bacterium]|nr:amidohydrolase family protein [Gemmatimonadota bacterium]
MHRASRIRLAGPSFAALVVTACVADAPAPAGNATLFTGARIITGDGSAPIENGAFVVENGRFTHVGTSVEIQVPSGTPHVDLSGKTVIPALINTHVHLGSTREQLIGQLEEYAYYGVGTVQSLGHDSAAVALALRNELVPGAARYLTAGRGITSPEPGRSEAPWWISSEEQARSAVQELAAQEIRLVKIWVDDRNGQYEKLSPQLFRAVIEEAHRHDQRVAAHIFALEDAKELLRAGIDAFAHGIRDRDIDDEGLALFREHPAVVLIPNLPDRGVTADLSWLSGTVPATQLQELQSNATDRPEVQQRFGVQARNLARLDEAGVRIAMGTDGSAPWAAHQEMEDMVAAGMSPDRVIVSATRNSAELLRLTDVGTIAAGTIADFVVLDANPLAAIANTRLIHAVYLRGTAVDRSAVSARALGSSNPP